MIKLTGEMGEFRRDPLGLFERLAREQGDMARMRMGLSRIVVLSNPALVEQVLVTENHHFRKNPATRRLSSLIGYGLLSSDGEDWKRQRRVTQPAFHRARIAALGDTMVDYAERLVDTWEPGHTYDMLQEMMELTLQIACKSLFGADVDEDLEIVRKAMAVVGDHFLNRFTSLMFLVPDWVPTPGNRTYAQAVHDLDTLVYRIIGSADGDRGDLLSLLMASGLSPKEVRDEVMTFFLAGHETTSLALTWSLYLLSRRADAWERMRREVAEVLGGRRPNFEDVAQLPYTRAVVDEALRMYPPAYLQGRQALSGVTIGGQHFDRGVTVLMSQWVIHHDPRYFDDPWTFRPERWLDGLAGRLPRFAYFPFGGGQRQCIGNAFAQLEAQLVLACLAQRVELELVPDQRIEPLALITLRPKFGIQMQVRANRPEAAELATATAR
jgi:cytochrome P450